MKGLSREKDEFRGLGHTFYLLLLVRGLVWKLLMLFMTV